jgi:integrase
MALASITRTDVEEAMRWAQVRGNKHWRVRDIARAARGLPPSTHDGRLAAEHVHTVLSAVMARAMDDESTRVTRNVVARSKKVRRPKTKPRAYTIEQLEELWEVLFTGGGNDPELDMLLVWLGLEAGARRGGGINLRVGHLNWRAQTLRMHEKGNEHDDQPVSMELIVALLGHALERGDVLAATDAGLDPAKVTVADVIQGRARLRPDRPVLYYRRRRRRMVEEPYIDDEGRRQTRRVGADDERGVAIMEPRPLTRRRYETLFEPIRQRLPWAADIGARPHDLRKTAPPLSSVPSATPSPRDGCGTGSTAKPATTSRQARRRSPMRSAGLRDGHGPLRGRLPDPRSHDAASRKPAVSAEITRPCTPTDACSQGGSLSLPPTAAEWRAWDQRPTRRADQIGPNVGLRSTRWTATLGGVRPHRVRSAS